MRSMRLVLVALLLTVPFAMKANAQVSVGIGVGPAVFAAPMAYGAPVCEWGYYGYYPYECAPYGYYGPQWFAGGLFIGAGPWFNRGWWGRGRDREDWGRRGWGNGNRGGYGYGAGFGNGNGYGYRGRYNGVRPVYGGGYRG